MRYRSVVKPLFLLMLIALGKGCLSFEEDKQLVRRGHASSRIVDSTLPWSPQGLHSLYVKEGLVPLADVAQICDLDTVIPSYRKLDDAGTIVSCIDINLVNDSANVYLYDDSMLSVLGTSAIWVVYQADRIVLMITDMISAENVPESKFSVPEMDVDNWMPKAPTCRITVADVKSRPLFLSDGHILKELKLQHDMVDDSMSEKLLTADSCLHGADSQKYVECVKEEDERCCSCSWMPYVFNNRGEYSDGLFTLMSNAVEMSILDFNCIWPSYRKLDGVVSVESCMKPNNDDSVDVYLRSSLTSSDCGVSAIWVVYQSNRIIVMVAGGRGADNLMGFQYNAEEADADWIPMTPNIKITIANRRERSVFLSDGYKLMMLQ